VILNDRLLAELRLSAALFTPLLRAERTALPMELHRLQHTVRVAWRQRAFELHPDRCTAPGAEELYKELGQYVAELLALAPDAVPTERPELNYTLETARGSLQVVFKV
jgi:hypothetical protein